MHMYEYMYKIDLYVKQFVQYTLIRLTLFRSFYALYLHYVQCINTVRLFSTSVSLPHSLTW